LAVPITTVTYWPAFLWLT